MGIQGLLQALKPYVEPVHVSKYSGQRVGIDAYSWLHKGAYACSWQQLRGADNRQRSDKLPQYVMYCMHRIKMLLYNNVTPIVVFDGGRLPLKALTEQSRRRNREENLQKAEQKLAEGDCSSAQDYFQRAVEITPSMAHELIKILRDERVEYVVAPYEADAQLAYLSTLAPEEGGVSAIITEDSDLLAYGCKVVLFKMDKFGNGEELCMDKILQSTPSAGTSFRKLTPDLFLAMCVLAGCDFLASIPGIGVKTARDLLAKYGNIHRVLNTLKFSKHAEFPEDYITNFWQAKAIFKHARVYEMKTKSLKFLNPLPDELLKEFDGDTEFLGPSWQTSFTFRWIRDLPQSRARAIAIGQLDPTTMCSFDVLPKRTPTVFSISKSPDLDFIQAQKREFLKMPKVEPLPPLAMRVSEESEVGWGSGTEPLRTIRVPITEMETEPGPLDTVIPSTPPEVDHEFLAKLQFLEYAGSHRHRGPEVDGHSQVSVEDLEECGLRQAIPNNNPFKSQRAELTMVHPNILSAPHLKLESTEDSSGLSAENSLSNFFSAVEDSQQLLSSGKAFTSQLNSLRCSSPVSLDFEIASCTTMDQNELKQVSAHVSRFDGGNYEASQTSINSCDVSILTEISPNMVAVSSPLEYFLTETPSSAPLLEPKDPLENVGKTEAAKNVSCLRKCKSASQIDRKKAGIKRSRGSFSSTPSGKEGSILKFFKPTQTPKKLVSAFQ